MHVLALGGNGFVGSHVVAALLDAGHRVSVADRTDQPKFRHGRPFDNIGQGVDDAIAVLPHIDVVCHLAWSTVPATSNADPIADITENLAGSVKLLEAMRVLGKTRIVYLSSGGAVYGLPRTTPIREEHALDPISAYGVTKVAFEKYLGMYAALHGVRPTIIRPSNPYGPGQNKIGVQGAVNTFLNAAATGENVTIWGDGSTIRDYLAVEDVARLVGAAVEAGTAGIYNCGSGHGTSLLELIGEVERITGAVINRVHRPARDFDPPVIVLDTSRARADFGWTPRVSLDVGLAAAWEWMRRG